MAPFGPIVLTQPFLVRRQPAGGTTAINTDGTFAASAAFEEAGFDSEAIEFGSGLAVPVGATFVIALFDLSIEVRDEVSAIPIFTPAAAAAQVEVDLTLVRANAPGNATPFSTRRVVIGSLLTLLGTHTTPAGTVRRRLLIGGGFNPPARPEEVMQTLLGITARAAGGGFVSHARADAAGVLNAITVSGI